jgi:uncharacterized membrane protein
MHWLRRSFIAGFFVTVPLVVSVAALVWIFQIADGLLGPVFAQRLGRDVPGLGILATAAGILIVGAVATNVIGKRILQRAEFYLTKVPVFRTIYAPIKQLIVAFSPESEFGFKRVVLVEDPRRGFMMGFLTREFVLERGRGPETLVAVYVPTNHLYLGDVLIFPIEQVSFPQMSVEQGIRVFLTGGMALTPRMTATGPSREPAGRR